MTAIEEDIYSTPDILRQTLQRVDERADTLSSVLRGPVLFLGCGSSYCVGAAAAALYEMQRGEVSQAMIASEYRPRPAWTHVAVSRTGRSTELVEAMRRAREVQARVALIRGDSESPAEACADVVLPLEFAPEQGVVQTRFITASMLALRLVIGGVAARDVLADVPRQIEQALSEVDVTPLTAFEHVVFLGREWRHGLAVSAALTVQETALMVAEGHQTLDYRHGPIATADAGTLVWCLDPPDDSISASVLDDVRRTGATARCLAADPLASLVQIQLLAVRLAEARGIDPDAPRNLTRAVEYSAGGS